MSEAADEPRACDLCGLPVPARPWRLQTPEREYKFCCEGCLGIFRLLHDPEVVATATPARS
jgi:hypothetical protein